MCNPARFLAAFLLVAASAACGEEYKSPSGYSLKYPQGWKIANQGQADWVNHEAQTLLKTPGTFPLTNNATYIFNPANRKFADNINIVVLPQTPRLNEDSVNEAVKSLKDAYQTAGWKVQSIAGELAEFDGKKAISVQTTVKMPQLSEPMKQWGVVFPGRTETYMITCSSLASGFAKREPLYRAALESFQFPPNQTPGKDAANEGKAGAGWLGKDPLGDLLADIPTETLLIGVGVTLGSGLLIWLFLAIAKPPLPPERTVLTPESLDSATSRDTFTAALLPDEPVLAEDLSPPEYR